MIIRIGGYFVDYSHLQRIVFVIDIFLISTICFSFGMLLSSIINSYMTSELDRSKEKNILFMEILSECLFTTFLIYFVIFLVDLLPTIAKKPPLAHLSFRLLGAEFLLTFSIIACQLKLLDKIRYIFNSDKDASQNILGNIVEDFRDCSVGNNGNDGKGFVCKPP